LLLDQRLDTVNLYIYTYINDYSEPNRGDIRHVSTEHACSWNNEALEAGKFPGVLLAELLL
jgi:hypothetical protein